jgi:hypothetical protein
MTEDSVAAETRRLVGGAVIVCFALVVLFAVLFAGPRLIGSKDNSGKPSASYDVHTRQLT